MPKDFSKKVRPNFAESPMYQEHDQKIEAVLDGQSENTNLEQPIQPIAPSNPVKQEPAPRAAAPQPKPQQPVAEPKPEPEAEMYKNVSVKMPWHIYEKLNKIKYSSGRRSTTIAQMVIEATEEYARNHS